MASVTSEMRLALIHRVIVPDNDHPKEYAIVVTDRRSIFIRQKQSRSNFVLRGEMRFGTALVTDVEPMTLKDYEQTDLESLAAGSGNLAVPHNSVVSLVVRGEKPKFRVRDSFVWLTMRMQKEIFQVYDFQMKYRQSPTHEDEIKFYAVPLGAYFKPKRLTQTRETILLEYALDILETLRKVLPYGIVTSNLGAAQVTS